MEKSLHKLLLEMKIELVIRRKKITDFEEEVAVTNVIHAVTEALKKIDK